MKLEANSPGLWASESLGFVVTGWSKALGLGSLSGTEGLCALSEGTRGGEPEPVSVPAVLILLWPHGGQALVLGIGDTETKLLLCLGFHESCRHRIL